MVKLVLGVFLAIGSALGLDWKTIDIDGVRFVPLSQVAEFYQLREPESKGDGVILRNRDVTMIFKSDSRMASLNKVGFRLERKLLKKGEGYFLSERDLVELLEPVLRPQRVEGLGNFDTVVLELDFPPGLPERALLIEELRSTLKRKGLKVIIFEDQETGKLDWAGFRERSEGDHPVLIHFAIRGGKRMALGSEAIGVSPEIGVPIATAIHWSILQQMKQNAGLGELEDERISVGRANEFDVIDVPACRLEMTCDFSRESTMAEFHRIVARSVGEAMSFARKAGQQGTATDQADEQK